MASILRLPTDELRTLKLSDVVPPPLSEAGDSRTLLDTIKEFRDAQPGSTKTNHQLVALLTRSHHLDRADPENPRLSVRPKALNPHVLSWYKGLRQLAEHLKATSMQRDRTQSDNAVTRSSRQTTEISDNLGIPRIVAVEGDRASPPMIDHVEFLRILGFGSDIDPIAEMRVPNDYKSKAKVVSLLNAIVLDMSTTLRQRFGTFEQGPTALQPVVGGSKAGKAYDGLHQEIAQIRASTGMSDAQLAATMRDLLTGRVADPTTVDRSAREVLQKVAYLMFAREGIRDPTNMALAAMTTDLIASGRMSWEEALALFRGSQVRGEQSSTRATTLQVGLVGGVLPATMDDHQAAVRILQRSTVPPVAQASDHLSRFVVLMDRWLTAQREQGHAAVDEMTLQRDMGTGAQAFIQDVLHGFFGMGQRYDLPPAPTADAEDS